MNFLVACLQAHLNKTRDTLIMGKIAMTKKQSYDAMIGEIVTVGGNL